MAELSPAFLRDKSIPMLTLLFYFLMANIPKVLELPPTFPFLGVKCYKNITFLNIAFVFSLSSSQGILMLACIPILALEIFRRRAATNHQQEEERRQ